MALKQLFQMWWNPGPPTTDRRNSEAYQAVPWKNFVRAVQYRKRVIANWFGKSSVWNPSVRIEPRPRLPYRDDKSTGDEITRDVRFDADFEKESHKLIDEYYDFAEYVSVIVSAVHTVTDLVVQPTNRLDILAPKIIQAISAEFKKTYRISATGKPVKVSAAVITKRRTVGALAQHLKSIATAAKPLATKTVTPAKNRRK